MSVTNHRPSDEDQVKCKPLPDTSNNVLNSDNTALNIDTVESNEANDNVCSEMDVNSTNDDYSSRVDKQSFEEVRLSETTTVVPTPSEIQNVDLSNTGSRDQRSCDQLTTENASLNNETDQSVNTFNERDNTGTQEQLSRHPILDTPLKCDHAQSISPTSELQSSITSNNITQSISSVQSQSTSDSSFVIIDDTSQLVDASKFEEPGLFYGSDLDRNRTIVHEDRPPTPPPESADDVLLSEDVTSELARQRSVTPKASGNDSETGSDDYRSIDTPTDNTSSSRRSVSNTQY